MSASRPETEIIDELKVFAALASHANVRRGNTFGLCLRASFSKSFHFLESAYKADSDRLSYYLTPSLRSICEDIIFLSFGAKLQPIDREFVFQSLMQNEVQNSLRTQAGFFQKFRPFQPVVRPGNYDPAKDPCQIRATEVWRQNGWKNLKAGSKPNTRQVAQQINTELLSVVYDFFYRLTSSFVHFSPQILLRSGWGDLKEGKVSFSPHHMDAYYASANRIYGGFLFSLYFELFSRFLRPGKYNQELVRELRRAIISSNRWPEMITYEEMNLELPSVSPIFLALQHVMSEKLERGFLSAGPILDVDN